MFFLQHIFFRIVSSCSASTVCFAHPLALHVLSYCHWKLSYLCEERFVDLNTLVWTLRQHVPASVPAVAHRRVGVGHAAEEDSPFIVKLLFGFSYTLMDCYHWIIQVWKIKHRHIYSVWHYRRILFTCIVHFQLDQQFIYHDGCNKFC